MEDYYTLKQAARELGMTAEALAKQCKENRCKIPFERRGAHLLFLKADVENYKHKEDMEKNLRVKACKDIFESNGGHGTDGIKFHVALKIKDSAPALPALSEHVEKPGIFGYFEIPLRAVQACMRQDFGSALAMQSEIERVSFVCNSLTNPPPVVYGHSSTPDILRQYGLPDYTPFLRQMKAYYNPLKSEFIPKALLIPYARLLRVIAEWPDLYAKIFPAVYFAAGKIFVEMYIFKLGETIAAFRHNNVKAVEIDKKLDELADIENSIMRSLEV